MYAFQQQEGCRASIQKKSGKALQWADTALLGTRKQRPYTSPGCSSIHCTTHSKAGELCLLTEKSPSAIRARSLLLASDQKYSIRLFSAFGCIFICFRKTEELILPRRSLAHETSAFMQTKRCQVKGGLQEHKLRSTFRIRIPDIIQAMLRGLKYVLPRLFSHWQFQIGSRQIILTAFLMQIPSGREFGILYVSSSRAPFHVLSHEKQPREYILNTLTKQGTLRRPINKISELKRKSLVLK